MDWLLSCKGGGIRGIITCSVIAEIEKQMGKPAREIFSFMAGTSTGALLAAALQVGIPASDILKIYTERSAEIFTPGAPWNSATYYAKGYRFDSANIIKVLNDVFGKSNGWTLNDCPGRILLTAVNVSGHIWYFVKDNMRNKRLTGKLSLVECAAASASAPTYFRPTYVHPTGGKLIGRCFDGGVAALANPVFQMCIEAFKFDTFQPENTRVLSLGTGYFPSGEVNEPQSLVGMVEWSTDTLIDSAADEQAGWVDLIWPGIQSQFDWCLPSPIDMADLSSIPTLVKVGQQAALATDWVKVLAA